MADSPSREPLVSRTIGDVRREVAAQRGQGRRVGCVPTMGALHAGHLSLIEAARAECDHVVVTLFVNPTQFGPNEDFHEYPRTWEADLRACRDASVDVIFYPEAETMYPPGFQTGVEVAGLSDVLEGASRPGHFRGVATVVLKLFNIVQPDVAYFGAKDFQQQVILRRMGRDLNVPVEIRTCPTVREEDGLALSSRNKYLTAEQRQAALALSQSLAAARERLLGGEMDVNAVQAEMQRRLQSTPGVELDYAVIADPETLKELVRPQADMVALVAARVGNTRLIDNMPVRLKSEKC